MGARLGTVDCLLVAVALGALAYVAWRYCVERSQPHTILRLREDVRRVRNALIGREDLDDDVRTLLRRLDYRLIVAADDTTTRYKRSIRVCVREDARFGAKTNHDMHLFALLHEVAHVMTPEWGHGPNFWQNFSVLLDVADDIGVLDLPELRRVMNDGDLPFRLCDHDLHGGYLP